MTKRGAKGRASAGRSIGRGAGGGDERDRLALHQARCRICKHPEREEIEREFLEWVSPRETAERWKFASYRAIYRHAHAVGLFQQRRENRQGALDCIIERVREVPVTASAVVAAIRLGEKLDREKSDDGGGERAERKLVLSLEGLPRTDAVTGHLGRERQGVEVATGAPPSPKAGTDEGPPSAGVRGTVADPHFDFGEDGRGAGTAWPKGKIEFAPRVRWRPGRSGPRP